MSEMKCPQCGFARSGQVPTGQFFCPTCNKTVIYNQKIRDEYLRTHPSDAARWKPF